MTANLFCILTSYVKQMLGFIRACLFVRIDHMCYMYNWRSGFLLRISNFPNFKLQSFKLHHQGALDFFFLLSSFLICNAITMPKIGAHRRTHNNGNHSCINSCFILLKRWMVFMQKRMRASSWRFVSSPDSLLFKNW